MKEFLDYQIFKIGKISLEVNQLLLLIVFAILVKYLLTFIKKIIYNNKKLEGSKKYTMYAFVKYVTYTLAIIVCFDIIGLNISIFLAGSAALFVGVGLGLQNLFSDFISGIIILLERTVKLDDIIEVNGMVCKVREINLRTTTVLTSNQRNIILPNTELTKNHLINWTHTDELARFDIKIGIGYEADVELAMQIMENAAQRDPKVSIDEKPFCRLEDFGDSAVIVAVYFWTSDIFTVENTKSRIRQEIFKWFKSGGIEIPYPQRVMHISEQTGS